MVSESLLLMTFKKGLQQNVLQIDDINKIIGFFIFINIISATTLYTLLYKNFRKEE